MYLKAVACTLRSRRFWMWQLGGALIYSIPASIRLATGNIHLPILSMFMVPWVTPYVPGNIVEKVLVNAFFPGGAGAVAGEILYSNFHGQVFSRKQKYLAQARRRVVVDGWVVAVPVLGLHAKRHRLLRRQPLRIPTGFSTQLPVGVPSSLNSRRSGLPKNRSSKRLPWVPPQKKLISSFSFSQSMSFHVRRKDREITSPKRDAQVLKATKYVTVALCMDNEPYLVSLSHGYDQTKNCLYFHCAPEGKKLIYAKANPQVWGQAVLDFGVTEDM